MKRINLRRNQLVLIKTIEWRTAGAIWWLRHGMKSFNPRTLRSVRWLSNESCYGYFKKHPVNKIKERNRSAQMDFSELLWTLGTRVIILCRAKQKFPEYEMHTLRYIKRFEILWVKQFWYLYSYYSLFFSYFYRCGYY